MYRIGVDVGGTNTDAVILQDRTVIAKFKSPTTPDIECGVFEAVKQVLRQAGLRAGQINGVMIGTTQFTNAFVERRRLTRVGVIRLALPATQDVPPFSDWPEDLAPLGQNGARLVSGGYEYDGRPLRPLDERGVAATASKLAAAGITSFAISSVFAHVNREMEDRAAHIVRSVAPQARVTVSADIGRVGLLERENACVMNAMLADLAHQVVRAFRRALADLSISAPFYISQNDGTLMSAEFVERFPVLTFASGPTNSMRGAAFLTGLEHCVVVDIGGTTTDVGVLAGGFPRESSIAVDIGGVRTNFRMPDVLSIGLGGGTEIRPGPPVSIGPQSVGHRLLQEARIFGGSTLTATDIVVAAGHADIGDPSKVRAVPASLVDTCLEQFTRTIEEAIDRMKPSGVRVPVVLVGGGAILVTRPLCVASDLIVPEHSDVVNAIGAAIAQVGAEVDRVFSYAQCGRDVALDMVRQEVIRRVVEAGGDAAAARVLDIEEIRLAYLPGDAVRVRMKAVSELSLHNGHAT